MRRKKIFRPFQAMKVKKRKSKLGLLDVTSFHPAHTV
jgi:hypothetical protein